jgi:3-dehydroquinate dehydratase
MKSMFTDPEQDVDDFYNAKQNNGEADWDRIYDKYDAAVDWPTCTFYKELMNKYPDAKVVLTVRTADSWYKSVKNTIHAQHANPKFKGEAFERFKRMTNAVVLDGVMTDVERFAKEEEVKQAFLDHNEEVKHYVPTDRLYVMQIGEGWEGLCKFLGKDVPVVPYPRGNSTDGFSNFVDIFSEKFV